MEKKLLYTAFIWAFIGVLSGVYYREITKYTNFGFDVHQQLSTVHTHLLVLGFIVQLLALVAAKALGAVFDRTATIFYWTWNIGVLITGGMMVVKGTMVVLGQEASSAALAGIAGLGHMCLAAGLIVLLFWLKDGLKPAIAGRKETEAVVEKDAETVH